MNCGRDTNREREIKGNNKMYWEGRGSWGAPQREMGFIKGLTGLDEESRSGADISRWSNLQRCLSSPLLAGVLIFLGPVTVFLSWGRGGRKGESQTGGENIIRRHGGTQREAERCMEIKGKVSFVKTHEGKKMGGKWMQGMEKHWKWNLFPPHHSPEIVPLRPVQGIKW